LTRKENTGKKLEEMIPARAEVAENIKDVVENEIL
jgi:hypothetical protein